VSPTTQAPAPTEASGQNYNWMLYNSLTSTVKPGASLKGKSEVDNRFLTGCAFVHDMFETNRSSSKILLVYVDEAMQCHRVLSHLYNRLLTNLMAHTHTATIAASFAARGQRARRCTFNAHCHCSRP